MSSNPIETTRPGDGENELRGQELEGSDRKTAADHAAHLAKRNPDTQVRVDDESDSLYSDGLEIEDGTPPMGSDARNQDNAR